MKIKLTEQQLYATLEKAITEELNEGFFRAMWNGAKNTAKLGAAAALAPGYLAAKGAQKVDRLFSGSDTLTSTVSDFFGGNNGSKGSNKKDSGSSKQSNNKNNYHEDVINEYGEPEIETKFGDRRLKSERIMVNNFLGTNRYANFGYHFVEKNQSGSNSVWSKKLEEAAEKLQSAGGSDQAARMIQIELGDWLKERDKAYKEYFKDL